jgi:uncharacterized protein YndB with AHSA1/START domain
VLPMPAPVVPAVVRTASFPVAPTELWRALTDPALLARWLAPEVDLPAVRPGATGRVVDDQGVRRDLVVDHVEPGRSLRFVWTPEHGGTPTVVEVRIAEDADTAGTTLTVVERPLVPSGPTTSASASVAAGHSRRSVRWDARLDALGELLGVLVAA